MEVHEGDPWRGICRSSRAGAAANEWCGVANLAEGGEGGVERGEQLRIYLSIKSGILHTEKLYCALSEGDRLPYNVREVESTDVLALLHPSSSNILSVGPRIPQQVKSGGTHFLSSRCILGKVQE